MRRGYTREAYVSLIQKAKEIIPNVTISSDFIAGFCGETEEDHLQTSVFVVSLELYALFFSSFGFFPLTF
jgi:tRNA A37 methylthiotransferase MiaB